MKTTNAYKGGRCWNGSHRDAGRIVHIIEGEEINGYWGSKALCGAKPGLKGYGWAKTNSPANCSKCLNKLPLN